MWNRFQAALAIGVLIGLAACATPPPPPAVPGAPSTATPEPGVHAEPAAGVSGAVNAVGAAVESVRTNHDRRESEVKTTAGTITIDCTVKLPDDPTDNPELCRSFQMAVIDEAGAEAVRFRFGNDARYRFAAKVGKKYRVRPLIGKNWEFSIKPDRDLSVGERARVQLRQKE